MIQLPDGVALRPYQVEAQGNSVGLIDGGKDPVISMPTGTGKTAVLAAVGREVAEMTGRRVLYKVHRTELADQIESWLRRVDPANPPSREQAEKRGNRGHKKTRHVVAMVQSIAPRKRKSRAGEEYTDDNRIAEYDPKEFALVVTDEGHHNDAPQWAKTDERFRGNPRCRFLAVSATWSDAAGTPKGRACGYNAVAYRMKPLEAIKQGWTVPLITCPVVFQGIDWGGVKTDADGLYTDAALDRVLAEEGPVHQLVKAVLGEAERRPTLVFCVSKKHVRAVRLILDRYRPGASRMIYDGRDSDDRDEFKAGFGSLYQFGVNCGIYTEGTDIPKTACVAIGRPCQSDVLAAQIVGRASRTEEGLLDDPARRSVLWYDAQARRAAIRASGKPNALVLDFVGLGARRLITSVDVLGADEPVAVRDYANRLLAGGAAGDVEELLERAELEWTLIQEEVERRSAITARDVRYECREVDLYDPRKQAADKRPMTVEEAKSPTEGQVWVLVKHYNWTEDKARSLSRKAAAAILAKYRKKEATGDRQG